METTRDFGRIWLGVFIAIGMMVSAYLVALTIEKVAPRRDLFTVKGYAERVVTSDFGRWQGQYTVRAATLEGAYRLHQAAHTKVMAFLAGAKVPGDEISVPPLSLRPVHEILNSGVMGDNIIGYEIVQRVAVEGKDVALVNRLASSASGLIQDGVEFTSYPPQYFYNELEGLKLALLRDAAANAAARAKALGQASGVKVGALRSARQGVFQITAYPSTETAAGGYYDTRALEKSVKAVVTAEFLVN